MQNQTYTSIEQLPITLTAGDIQRILGISRAGAYNLLSSQGFPTLRIGGRIVVPKEQFIRWMDRNTGGDAA